MFELERILAPAETPVEATRPNKADIIFNKSTTATHQSGKSIIEGQFSYREFFSVYISFRWRVLYPIHGLQP